MTQESTTPLGPYLATPIKLFIADQTLLKQTAAALAELGFSDVSASKVPSNYFQAMRQLFGELMRVEEGIVLVNHPPKQMKDTSGLAYSDWAFADFYSGVLSFNKSGRRSATDLLGCCVPVFPSAQDHDIRLRVIEDLFPFGIVGAFMLQIQDMYGDKSQQQQERTYELHDYLLEYFQTRKGKLAELREYKSAEELKKRRAESSQIMADVEKLKQAGEFDKAIALCRQAIEVLPTDPEAYLEGGRLLVKKKKYPPAMEMFHDAEQVAEELPAPNQEIANLRVAQTKDYIAKKRSMGQPPDPEVIRGYLEEAEANFNTAISKAEKVVTARSDQAASKSKDMVADIAENILTLDLGQALGEGHPMVRKLNKVAQQTLTDKVGADGQVQPKHLVHFGLGAFFDGDLATAMRYLKEAANNEATFQDACTKLNYIGTQLRQKGDVDGSIKVYKELLALRPSFRGVALFNMAVAMQTKAHDLSAVSQQASLEMEIKAVGRAVEAIYVDPNLPKDANFYQNTVIAPQLKRISDILREAANVSAPGLPQIPEDQMTPTDRACRQAVLKLEALLKQGKDRDALQLMFNLAQKLRPFFMEFQKHASQPVADFAARLHPVLLKNDKPKMVIFGKILGVLVAQMEKARPKTELPQQLQLTLMSLNRGDQASSAMELAKAFYSQPALASDQGYAADETMVNLCREVLGKLSNIDFAKFKAGDQRAA